VNHHAIGSGRRFQLIVFAVALFMMFGAAYALPVPHATTSPQAGTAITGSRAVATVTSQAAAEASEKKVLTADDYASWRSISGQQISDDGKWVAYGLQFSNTPADEAKPVLHLLNLETDEDVEVPNATGGTFSSDSRWIAYQVDPSGGGGGRGGRGRGGEAGEAPQARRGRGETPDEPQRAELRNLSTGDVQSWQNIQSFTFSDASTHLILRRRPPEAAGGGRGRGGAGGGGGGQGGGRGGGDTPDGPRGVDVVVHNLTTGRDQLLGSVGDISFNKEGDLLAYTVDAAVKDSNGLFVLDLANARMHALDNDAKSYNRLTWNEDGTALAVLKGLEVDEMRERANVLIAFADVRAALDGGGQAAAGPGGGAPASPATLDPATAEGFPEGWVVSDRGAVSWSHDNARVFFGMKEQVDAPDAGRDADSDADTEEDRDEVANVDIWNTADERVQSLQMRRANADRNFTYRQAFDVATGTFIKLADDTMRDIDIAREGRWAVGRDTRGYIHDHIPAAADIYRVDTTTGERTLMFQNQLIGSHLFGISADGNYFLYWKDDKVQAYDLEAGTNQTLGGDSAPSFLNMEFDRASPRPAYGIAGYAEDGSGVIAQHRYDLWLLPYDGSDATNLTKGVGADNDIRFRYVRTVPDDQPGGGGRGGRGGGRSRKIDLSKPVTLSAYGQWTKTSGFYELAEGQLTEIVYEDASFSTPRRAKDAETFLFTRQTFVEFPDLRTSGPDFSSSTKITDANPQQAEYKWGRRILFDFENKDGVRLQGILALPDDYQPGEKRPMLVTFYEKNSQNLHRYTAPRYLTGMGSSPTQAVSEGYITMLPDIHFRTGSSHVDMLECVEAAVQKVIEMGYADPDRIGLNGHSYGGQGAAFIGTRSRMFAAVAMGAGVTDLYSDFNQNWGWTYDIDGGSGNNGFNYYIYGQGRQAVSPWENPDMYMFESALTHAPEVTQPFLIMHGTSDPTVAFQNGLGFYNALRFNGKTAILLAYPGEGHGLRRLPNRKDLTTRYFEFFNHYLKGEPAPEWMTKGVPFLEKGGR
jgi:dipeptidyl aminopeptidase/acylaminoacyl peptidase